MQLSPLSSTASSGRMGRIDPGTILLPIFIGFLRAAAFVPFIAMFLGPEFGLSKGLSAPNGWALAAIGAIGLWSVRILPSFIRDRRMLNLLLVIIGIACWIGWMALEPEWHVGDVLRDPISIVSGRGEFGWTFVLTFVFWVFTLRLALDEREQSPEGVRGIMVRSLVGIFAAILLAAIVGGDMGDAGLSAAYVALPVALVSGIGAVGLSEMVDTRSTAKRRGATVPGWSRWARTWLGSTVVILVITFVAAIVLGPGFLQLVIDSVATIWRGFATVLLWIVYGVVYFIFWAAKAVAWLLNYFFDMGIEAPDPPDMGEQGPTPDLEAAERGEVQPWKYAQFLRFGGFIALVVVGLLILARFVRFRATDADLDVTEERSSVFSGALLRKQLSNLFRRRGQAEKPRKIDLAGDPTSVRESMLYLQVLAGRLGSPRLIYETPADFTKRLGHNWPEAGDALTELNRRYERTRYGETEEDRAAVVAAWRTIWANCAESPGAMGD